ncbi:MAG: hypothetical protein CMC37_05165 [Flavobacteriaceae bacterium]|nr:hypothetical protein [Flavobacteriaceae bacterium]
MKKNYILTLLLSLLFTIGFQAQVVIGEGTNTSHMAPVNPYYEYSYSQTIYTAAQINASGTITGVQYFATESTGLENTGTWDLYMGHTALDEHTPDGTSYSWVDPSTLTLVYSGAVEVVDGVVSITLDTPFEYNGTDNLLVAGHDTMDTNDYDASTDDFYGTETGGPIRSLVTYNDTDPIDGSGPPNPSTFLSIQNDVQVNIVLEGITQSCSNPSGFSVDNIMGTTADVSWTSASDYGWEYINLTSEDDAPGDSDSGTSVSDASVSVSGLTPLTDYIFYARTVCASENSAWSAFPFTTACADLFELPFIEGFNAVDPAPSETEICWTILDLSPDEAPNNYSWNTNGVGSFAFEGDHGAFLYTGGNQGKNDDYLISARLNLTGNDRLKFAAKSYTGQPTNSMEVLMSSTGNAAEDFTIVLSQTTEYASEDWTEVSIDLSAYSGAHYIAFRVPPTATPGYYMQLDAVIVEVNPTCDTPLNVAISNITSSSADASWDAGGTGETEWEYIVQTAGDPDPTGSGTEVSTNAVTLDGLTQGGEYDFYVRAVCGTDNYSEWTPLYGVYFMVPPVGGVCTDPIVIDALPYSTTDTTENYQDDYSGSAGENCNESAAYYLNGDDVVYGYTATSDTSINVFMSPDALYSGIFVYDSCDDIGVECVAGIGASDEDDREFDMNVYSGTTYYFVISTWASPQSVGYDLVISENTCSDPVIIPTTSNCDASTGEWTIDVDVSELGSSSSYAITDDLGNVQYAQTTGVLTFGPYTGSSPVTFTATGDDSNCDQTFTVLSSCQACDATYSSGCGYGDGIVSFTMGNIYNWSGCNDSDGENGYSVYTGNVSVNCQDEGCDYITDLAQGETYDITVETGWGDQWVTIWIDFNDDYQYTEDEKIVTDHIIAAGIGSGDHSDTFSALIPADANLGEHTLRIRTNYQASSGDPCTTEYLYGEAEDYAVVITEALSINDVELADLRIYPNPVDGNYVTIKSPIGGDKYVELFDINGRRVLSTIISGDMLDISSINTGFYMVEVTINGYKKVSKLIIE